MAEVWDEIAMERFEMYREVQTKLTRAFADADFDEMARLMGENGVVRPISMEPDRGWAPYELPMFNMMFRYEPSFEKMKEARNGNNRQGGQICEGSDE